MIHSKRQAAGLVIGTLLFAMSAPVYSIGILDAYSLALEKDPTFRAAIKEKEAGDENENIGRAGLLPKVSLNYQNSPRNWQTQSTRKAISLATLRKRRGVSSTAATPAR